MAPRPLQSCIEAVEKAMSLAAPGDEGQLGRRFILAQLRCRLGPALEADWPRDPTHLALFGGTNTGKSTIANLLLGQPLAGMRVTARFSQHLEAFHQMPLIEFPTRLAGYQRFHNAHPPRQSDEDLREHGYRPAYASFDLGPESAAPRVSPKAVVWDAPDFSTEAAQAYLGAVVDALGLATVAIFCATDESYADDRGLILLKMAREAGIPLVVAANKIAADDAVRGDIRGKIAEALGLPEGEVPLVFLPRVEAPSAEERFAQLAQQPESRALADAISAKARSPGLKDAIAQNVARFVGRHWDAALDPLKSEAEALRLWDAEVASKAESLLYAAYRRDYLNSVHYSEYNQALVRLLGLIDVPGIGPILRGARQVVSLPWTLVKGAFDHFFGGGEKETRKPPEHQVLESLIDAYVAELRSLAQERALSTGRPAWLGLARALGDAAAIDRLYGGVEAAYKTYRTELDAEILRRAEAILMALEDNPILLNTLRTGTVTLNLAVVALAIKTGGVDWSDAIIGPLTSGLMQLAVEYGFEAYLAAQKAALKQFQADRIRQFLQRDLLVPLKALMPAVASAAELADLKTAWAELEGQFSGRQA